jgi:putative serine protease PepD
VLDGFLSPNHTVEFAVLGVFCNDAIGGGAQIQQVTPGSPADKAGLKPGDIITDIASSPIATQVAFAGVMLQQKVGKKIPVLVQRGGKKLLVDVTPTKSTD